MVLHRYSVSGQKMHFFHQLENELRLHATNVAILRTNATIVNDMLAVLHPFSFDFALGDPKIPGNPMGNVYKM